MLCCQHIAPEYATNHATHTMTPLAPPHPQQKHMTTPFMLNAVLQGQLAMGKASTGASTTLCLESSGFVVLPHNLESKGLVAFNP